MEDPVVQPMWGRILKLLPDGSMSIFWIVGPNEIENDEAVLPKRDVAPALIDIDPDRWFYGTAKCYADYVLWVEQPEQVPAPDDEQARKSLWRSLPTEYAGEINCWPLKFSGSQE